MKSIIMFVTYIKLIFPNIDFVKPIIKFHKIPKYYHLVNSPKFGQRLQNPDTRAMSVRIQGRWKIRARHTFLTQGCIGDVAAPVRVRILGTLHLHSAPVHLFTASARTEILFFFCVFEDTITLWACDKRKISQQNGVIFQFLALFRRPRFFTRALICARFGKVAAIPRFWRQNLGF